MTNDIGLSYESYEVYKEQKRVEQMSPLQMVREFAVTMGQPLDLKPDDDGFEASDYLGFKLVEEEFSEFMEAYLDEDDIDIVPTGQPTDVLKELADLVYTAYGYAARRGWNLDKVLAEVHQNNLSRCIWEDGTIHRNEQGKILKRPDYKKLDLEKYV